MPLLNSILSWFAIKRLNRIELFKKYPINVQRDEFFSLIEMSKDTIWGKTSGYDKIHTIKEYKKRVAVQTYEEISPYIERVRQGEKNVLWPGETKWFAKSSGTTNDKSKFIPVTREALEDCHFRGAKDVIAIYNSINVNTQIFSEFGKALVIGGSQQINKYNNEIYYGDLSAVLMENTPFWARFIRTPNLAITLMDEWEEKIEKMALATINENVTNISGVPSWTLVLLKRILEITGKENLIEVWPNLELFVHGGVSFVPYREQYNRIIPSDKMNYLETYNASEGFFAIQDDPNTNDMLLMLDLGVFYEFMPIEEIGKEDPETLQLDEVEIGQNYAIIISTNGGLWRYMIGDTVMFTSKFPFKIKITGRTKHFINAFGEELIVDNAEKALEMACERTNATIREYTAAPIYMGENQKGGHEWLIEFETEPSDLEYFTELLDSALKSQNSDYEAKRYKSLSLQMPVVRIAPKGLFYAWLKEKGKLGGQNKIPRLANNRNYIDDLLKMNVL